jgi:hypothetical protein
MKPNPSDSTVFIVCNDPRHSKHKAVTNFVRVSQGASDGTMPDEGWLEVPTGQRPDGYHDLTLPGHGHGPVTHGTPTRTRYDLKCPACPKSSKLRSEVLFRALDSIYAHRKKNGDPNGVCRVSLTELDAIVRHMSSSGD